ncbi:hypothetical protein KC19_8G049800 [Ceratodon purpureus]|uniref:Uncharacterized protein n=1 Tax=Ceratodon purpureus TaxID=3225 RepID=A0A8T0GV96_CERPU|nr:hypothetical protein KC19_8G049800 [Ceratodon purpureus]
MAGSNTELSSNKMEDVYIGTSGIGGGLHKDIRNKWSFDYTNNLGCPDSDPKTQAIKLAQFAYFHWSEKLKESQQLEDRKKNDRRDYQTEIYQIIGFYSVFQGVIFQGVTSMASNLECGFYKIPVILSVIASAATFVGIYAKFNNIADLNLSINEDKIQTKAFHDTLRKVEEYNHVTEFNISQIDEAINGACNRSYDGEEHSIFLKWGVLGFLIIFSAFFAYLDYVVMCRGYR